MRWCRAGVSVSFFISALALASQSTTAFAMQIDAGGKGYSIIEGEGFARVSGGVTAYLVPLGDWGGGAGANIRGCLFETWCPEGSLAMVFGPIGVATMEAHHLFFIADTDRFKMSVGFGFGLALVSSRLESDCPGYDPNDPESKSCQSFDLFLDAGVNALLRLWGKLGFGVRTWFGKNMAGSSDNAQMFQTSPVRIIPELVFGNWRLPATFDYEGGIRINMVGLSYQWDLDVGAGGKP